MKNILFLHVVNMYKIYRKKKICIIIFNKICCYHLTHLTSSGSFSAFLCLFHFVIHFMYVCSYYVLSSTLYYAFILTLIWEKQKRWKCGDNSGWWATHLNLWSKWNIRNKVKIKILVFTIFCLSKWFFLATSEYTSMLYIKSGTNHMPTHNSNHKNKLIHSYRFIFH